MWRRDPDLYISRAAEPSYHGWSRGRAGQAPSSRPLAGEPTTSSCCPPLAALPQALLRAERLQHHHLHARVAGEGRPVIRPHLPACALGRGYRSGSAAGNCVSLRGLSFSQVVHALRPPPPPPVHPLLPMPQLPFSPLPSPPPIIPESQNSRSQPPCPAGD